MNTKKIDFKNMETNKSISLPIDKKMIFIYGKNGTGKTTLSKSIKAGDVFVFNEDFIHKNVYIISEDGATINQNTKNNFSELLIGEEEINLKKKIQSFEEFKKKVVETIKTKNDIITALLLKYRLSKEDNILESKYDSEFSYNYDDNIENQFNNYSLKSDLILSIKDDKDLVLKVNQLDKQENLVELNKEIENNKMLKAYLFKEMEVIDGLNETITSIKNNECEISKLEKFAKEKNVSSEFFPLIQSCLNIQKETNNKNCFLCGTPDVNDKINDWNKIINDKMVKQRTDLLKELDEYIKLSELIIKRKDLYNSVAPKTIKCIENFIVTMKKLIKSVNDKTYLLLTINDNEIDFGIKETKELKESIRNYILFPFEKEMIFNNSLDKQNQNELKNYKDELDVLLSNNSEHNETSINKILNELGLTKEMKISIDHLGGKVKYKLELKNGNINTLSDGQKHKLALSIFLNYIKSKELENKIIIFDDPVVSLDESGYHLFKSYLIKNVMKKDINISPTLIILTHNFNYLYVQVSNIISNQQFKENAIIYKLTPSKLQVLDFHYFELDDIALFKECLQTLKYKFQLNDLSAIYLKIFRIFLDLSLRIKGIPDTLEIHEEISKLNLSDKDEMRLKSIHKNLCSISKHPNSYFTKSKENLILLKEAIDILGYPYIKDEEIELLDKLTDNAPFYENDIHFILKEIKEILFSKENHYINYLNHPRISFTQNILSTSMNQ